VHGSKAAPVFNDLQDYWFPNDEHSTGQHEGRFQPGWYSVQVPKTGTTIKVVKVDKRGYMTVKVGTSN
jgi:immune inhibitor A